MSTIVVGLVLTVIVVTLVTSWRRAGHAADLGSVSHQWIAEHRHSTESSRQ